MSTPSPGHVLVVGDVMTDIIVVPEGPLVRGSDRRARIRSRPGGSGSNQAIWLGAMGAKVRFAGRVGAGDKAQLEGYFRQFGVEPVLAADEQAPTGVLVSVIDTDGERSFLTDRGANLGLCAADLPGQLLDGAAILVISGYSFFAEGPRTAVRRLLAEARARRIPFAVDPASVGFLEEVGVSNFLEWTRGASLLFANESEARALSGREGLENQMQALSEHYGCVVIKQGSAGAAVGGKYAVELRLPAPQVEVIDTTGAGDAFAAAFVCARLNGAPIGEALAGAIAAGARAVQTIGGQPAAPAAPEVPHGY